MKTNRLAVPANSSGVSRRRVSAPMFRFKSPLIRTAVVVFVAVFPGTASALNLAWNPNPESDIASYQLSYGTSPGYHPVAVSAGLNTSASVSGLQVGTTYYFVVTATNQAGLQSAPSAEISYQVPNGIVSPPPPPSTSIPLISSAGWTLKYASSEETGDEDGRAVRAFDGNPNTYWISRWFNNAAAPPHDLQIDLGSAQSIQGFRYLPRQDGYDIGNVGMYEFYVSMDGVNWGPPVATGSFTNSKTEKEVLFSSKTCRYIQFRALTDLNDGAFNGGILCCVAELGLLQGEDVPVPVNEAPTAVSKSLTTPGDVVVAIHLDASDANGDSLSYEIVSGPGNGTLAGTAPNLTYTPAPGFSGSDSFTFRARDAALNSNPATISITVEAGVPPPPPNIRPLFAADPIVISVAEDSAVAGQLVASDPDEGGALAFSKISGPSWLTVSPGGLLGGTPSNQDVGVNSFTVQVADSWGASSSASLVVTVNNTNDAPVFVLNPITCAAGEEDVAYVGETIADTAADADAGDSIFYSKVSGPDWLEISAGGGLSGMPPVGSQGMNIFIVRATDQAGESGDSLLRIQINSTDLPLPWEVTDLGNPGQPGHATYESQAFTLEGSGTFAGTSDSGCFVWQALSGDGSITARLISPGNGNSASMAGVMIRDSLASNSQHCFLGMDGRGGFRWLRRSSTGGSAGSSTSGSGAPPDVWLRLVRKGGTVYAYKSTNGVKWSRVASLSTKFGRNCHIGLVVASGGILPLSATFAEVDLRP